MLNTTRQFSTAFQPVCESQTEQGLDQLSVCCASDNSVCRQQLESLVHVGFKQAYKADIRQFMPVLVGVGQHKAEAVLGLRNGLSPLFTETYLNAPIERILAGTPLAAKRERIVEIGNLYSNSRRYTLPLLLISAIALYKQDYSVLVFTATAPLRTLLKKSGVTLTVLADADISAVGDDWPRWGSYYDTAPQVVAVSLPSIISQLFDNQLVRRIFARVASQCTALSAELGEQL